MFNKGFLLFPDVNDFDVIMIYQSVIYTTSSLSFFLGPSSKTPETRK